MADAAVAFLLDSLMELMSDHIKLVSGAQTELDQLDTELRIMKAFLEDASSKQNKDKLFKVYEKRIRDVVYEVEDTIDSCITNPKSCSLARKVKALINEKVKPVSNQLTNMQIRNMGASSYRNAEAARRNSNQAPREDNVVGFGKETKNIINRLNENSDVLDVISITGMPGIGKTTLARKIYSDPIIRKVFTKVIWVYVSQDFKTKDVFITILKEFIDQDMSNMSDDELAPLVREYLNSGNFLIFFDDVWTVEAWRNIEAFLPNNIKIKLGKVLITSRSEKVDRYANSSKRAHNGPCKLGILEQEESWELLQFEVFRKLGDCPQNLEDTGKRIAEKCDGHPLAIVVIGEILVERTKIKKEWERVSESVETCLIYQDKEKRMENIISLSFNSLPYDLRDCFLYLGIFPRNSVIPVWKLTQLWIAERFVQHKPGKSLEETAQDNLKDLIDRNLVILDKTKADGSVKTCRVHGMIREFCLNEAAFEKQNLFKEVIKSKEGVFEPSIWEIKYYRRFCINSYVKEFLLRKPKVPHARSFLDFSNGPLILEKKDITSIIDAFDLLRVLDAYTIRFPKFPSKLTKLVLLRLVTLSGDKFKVLPKQMSKLSNIQTLIVHTPLPTLKVEANIWEMTHLKYFKTKASIISKVVKTFEHLVDYLPKVAQRTCLTRPRT